MRTAGQHAARPLGRACLGVGLLLGLAQVGLVWSAAAQPPSANRALLSAEDARLRLNPNTATPAELELLPRIGPKLAASIVAYRDRVADRPAFQCATDLDRVPRIGPVTVDGLRPFLAFPETAAAAGCTSSLTRFAEVEADEEAGQTEEAP